MIRLGSTTRAWSIKYVARCGSRYPGMHYCHTRVTDVCDSRTERRKCSITARLTDTTMLTHTTDGQIVWHWFQDTNVLAFQLKIASRPRYFPLGKFQFYRKGFQHSVTDTRIKCDPSTMYLVLFNSSIFYKQYLIIYLDVNFTFIFTLSNSSNIKMNDTFFRSKRPKVRQNIFALCVIRSRW